MVAIPQVITSDRASGAQVIDGSLKFDSDGQYYLQRTPSSAGNRRTWTWSGWLKIDGDFANRNLNYGGNIFFGTHDGQPTWISFNVTTPYLQFSYHDGSSYRHNRSAAIFRDSSSWYHIVVALDTTQGAASSRLKMYVNGTQLNEFSTSYTIPQDTQLGFNNTYPHNLGASSANTSGGAYDHFGGSLSNVYFKDGLALGPEYFGFTDPLTNIWKPKKFKAEGTTYNNGTVWSSGSTVTGGSISNAADGFDGDLSSSGAHCTLTSTDSSTTANVKFAVSFKNVTKVEVFVHSASSSGDTRGTCETPNGVTFTSPTLTSASQSFHTIYEGEPIRLKNIGWGINQNGQTGTSSDAFRAFRINGEILIDSTTRNLAFSNTAPSSIFSSNTLLTWAGGTAESNWTLSNSNKTATYSGSSSYSDVYTAALDSSTIYAFRLTSTGVDGNGGWFFTDDTSVSGTHPDERGGDTLGQRANETTLGAHGSFATANSVSAGQGAMSGFGDSQPSDGSQIDFVINMSARKVWVKAASSGSYVGGGDPTNASSTASFLLPSGTIYFGNVQYSGSDIITFGDDTVFSQSFYLPMDGNSPIGEDKSGLGNDYTPVNFGGSVALDNPLVSGARPIMNTTQGASQAGVGVFGSRENKYYTVTTANGSVYQFDITSGDNPSLEFIRGATYRFDYSSYTGHPVLFSSSNPDSSTTAYTEGTSIASNVISFTVPHDAPDTLYYYCSNHPTGMNGAISITTDNTKADQFASNCVLAMPLSGANSDVSASIACTSTTKTITSNGSPAASSSSSNFYSGSFLFDGTDDALTSSSCGSGATEYTMECWFNTDGFSQAQRPINMSQDLGGNRYLYAEVKTDKTLQIREESTGSAVSANAVFAADKWHHVAVSYDGVRLRGFVDGVFVVQTSANGSPVPLGTNMKMRVGADESNPSSNEFDGHIQDVRVYFGACKYTATNIGEQAFVPAATSPDILPDTPSGVSGSSKLTKITDGAVSFDGTGDYLDVGTSSDYALGTGDFTIEMYVFRPHDGRSSNNTLFATRGASGTSNGFNIGIFEDASGRRLYMYSNGHRLTYANEVPVGWVHIAITRSGTALKSFINGVLEGTGTTSQDYTNTSASIGSIVGGSAELTLGFISNFRLIKGTALYTKNFTPPFAPLTNVTNTKLLCCQSNSEGPQKTAVIPSVTGTATAMWPLNSDINDDSGNSNTLTENGGSTSFTSAASNSFGITNAANFAKDGKYLSYAVTPASAWTIDGYIRLETTTTSAPYILGWNGTNGSDTCFGFPEDGSRKFNVFGSFGVLDSGVVAEIGRWYHIRMTTNSTSDLKLYVDGVLVAQQTSSDGGPASPITFGDVQSGRFSGQIAGVRYTPTDLGAPPLGGETTSSGVTSNSPSVGVGLAGNVAATNFNPFITDINTVRGQETGYATLNPLFQNPNGNTTSDGNLTQTTTAGNGHYRANFNIGASSGKFYFEYTPTAGAVSGMVGLCEENHGAGSNLNGTTAYSYYGVTGNKQGGPSAVDTAYGATYTYGDVIGVAFDSDNNTLEYFKNGVSEGVAFTSFPNYPYYPAFSAGSSSNTVTYNVNFGQKPFKYAPPDGFQPLNAANLRPETVIPRSDQFVGVTTYTGNGSAQSINVGLEPDLVWIKSRSGAYVHYLVDTVRGAQKRLSSDSTNAEATNAQSLTTFNIDGFSLGNEQAVNENTDTFVSWCWKAGGSKNTFNVDDVGYASAAAAGLTGGDITPVAASVGTKQGFSIIQYQGNGSTDQTIPHGLTQAPDFSLIKNMDGASNWTVFHRSVTTTTQKVFYLNTTGAIADYSGGDSTWWGTLPGASVFTIGATSTAINNGTNDMISYHWHDVPGLQKFGSFIGNANADGPFIELGFRPSVIIIKRSDGGTENWTLWDAARNPINVMGKQLYPNLSSAEADAEQNSAYGILDFVSNGVKIRGSHTSFNSSGHTFIYAAWAEAPTVNLFGGGSNAR